MVSAQGQTLGPSIRGDLRPLQARIAVLAGVVGV